MDDIASLCDGRVAGGSEVVISALCSMEHPKAGALAFAQPKAKDADLARLSMVGAILCVEADLDRMPAEPAKIVVDKPHRAFASIGRHLFPASLGPSPVSLSDGASDRFPDARVSTLAEIEDGAVIGPGAVIGDHAAVGRGSMIGANAVIADSTQIGRDCRIGANAVLQYALVGNRVIIHGGAQIGQDGFGFVPGDGALERVPQLGRVIIQDGVEIGSNATIDRGALDDTVIGEGTKIDNLVQIAHNVRIGRHCVIAAQSGVSGSVVIGDGCMLGGGVGIADHVTIGSGVQIGAASGVMHDIPDGERWVGSPAMPVKQFFRQVAALRKLSATDKKRKNSD
ncbi:MAG: UDP-3-O-(3-hydroxymyristoyl)glucosamine N-acyltransferase [Oricola sp.]|nr:UDP-3-O-(3-hydroxymyristoyl)glucosamine N-acyltransferase [Oricola sp.]MCI5076984.1 UDP-3-O-(3-hydroxymyristoyl)glucosamine N-acyltransferase [Oricola sp.]